MSAPDIIRIQHITAQTRIGIYPHERLAAQPVVIDVEFSVPTPGDPIMDDIEHTINYKAVSQHITAYVQTARYQLIETLARATADSVLSTFKLPCLTLTLVKPQALPDQQTVSITVVRQAQQGQE